jgi:hypothetical protein
MIIQELRDSKNSRYVILEDVYFTNQNTHKTFYCPRGFVTDYASTKLFKFDEKGQPAALMHDVDYWLQEKTRAQADADFRDNLIFLGVNKIKCYTCYFALRLAGWRAWRQNTNNRSLFLDKDKVLTEEELKKITENN